MLGNPEAELRKAAAREHGGLATFEDRSDPVTIIAEPHTTNGDDVSLARAARGCAEDLGPGIAVVDLVVVTPVVAQGAPVRELRHFRVERQVSYGATLPEASRLGSDDDEGGRAPRPPQRHVAGLFVRMNE